MPRQSSRLGSPKAWLEAFVLVNLAFLSLDIYLAHSANDFRERAEYVPLYFSLTSPPALLLGLALEERWGRSVLWRGLGHIVGWAAIVIGVAGVVLHLESRFFSEQTLESLVYAAPFAAPLAYTGLGLLLIMNRMVEARSEEWARWVLFLALGGFVGNFVFSLTDHAQNGFFHPAEWVPVVSSAFAVGALATLFLATVSRSLLAYCGGVLLVQAAVGLLGFYYHAAAIVRGTSVLWFEKLIFSAPPLAPLLFPDLVVLAGIGLWALSSNLPPSTNSNESAHA
jgi:hypothetical protein